MLSNILSRLMLIVLISAFVFMLVRIIVMIYLVCIGDNESFEQFKPLR